MLGLAPSGCSDGPRSCELSSSSLVMFATIIDDDDGVEVEVEFETATDILDNRGTALELCPDSDQLTINGQTPEEVRALGHLYYVVALDAASTQVEIDLVRTEGESIAVLVETPPRFTIDGPASGSEHSRAQDLLVEWSPMWAEGEMKLAIEDKIGSDCIVGLGHEELVEDSGSFVLPAGTLQSGGGGDGGSCEVKVSLTRALEASYPEQLAPGGAIEAIVKRRLPFNSVD